MHAIISIHDVMPATLDRVRAIVEHLPAVCREHLILLVVPGLDWRESQIDTLRQWQSAGMRLAGHGWTHEARKIRGIYHRLHALLISRRAAEHLSLDADEIESLMKRNHAWFVEHGLETPDYYVPPAWALGSIGAEGLERTPFRFLETTSRLTDLTTGKTRLLPLVGFEADTRLRQHVLTVVNKLNEMIASPGRPLRISIHPFDYDHRLARQLDDLLARVERSVPVDEALSV